MSNNISGDNHRHDIQFIRCKCGLSFPSYQKWIDHFKYRYMLSNKDKLPVNPENQMPVDRPIDFKNLKSEVDQFVSTEIIAYHSGEHSHDDGQKAAHKRKQLGVEYP